MQDNTTLVSIDPSLLVRVAGGKGFDAVKYDPKDSKNICDGLKANPQPDDLHGKNSSGYETFVRPLPSGALMCALKGDEAKAWAVPLFPTNQP